MKKVIILSLICFTFLYAQTETTKLKLPAKFSDKIVLQQKTDAAFWGTAEPNQKINISASWGKSVLATSFKLPVMIRFLKMHL